MEECPTTYSNCSLLVVDLLRISSASLATRIVGHGRSNIMFKSKQTNNGPVPETNCSKHLDRWAFGTAIQASIALLARKKPRQSVLWEKRNTRLSNILNTAKDTTWAFSRWGGKGRTNTHPRMHFMICSYSSATVGPFSLDATRGIGSWQGFEEFRVQGGDAPKSALSRGEKRRGHIGVTRRLSQWYESAKANVRAQCLEGMGGGLAKGCRTRPSIPRVLKNL